MYIVNVLHTIEYRIGPEELMRVLGCRPVMTSPYWRRRLCPSVVAWRQELSSESYVATDGQWSWNRAPSRGQDQMFIAVRQSELLTWVCRLELLLAFASGFSAPSPATHDHILLSKIWDCPKLGGQVPSFASAGTGWLSFPSPPTTHRQVFGPAFTSAATI
jgi:hypothetical protein